MIRRSPAEYYLRYLLLDQPGAADDELTATFSRLQLDLPPDKGYIARVRESLHAPEGFSPRDPRSTASYKYLSSQKVHMLFFPDTHVQGALRVLESPQAKEIMESMLLVAEPRVSIARRLLSVGVSATEKAIGYYAHFFFNLRLIDRSEVRTLITLRWAPSRMATAEEAANATRAMYGDPRYMAATAQMPMLAAMRLQLRHGVMPTRVDYIRLAEGARFAGLLALTEQLMDGGPRSFANARDLATVVSVMNDMLKDTTGASDELQKTLQKLTLETSGSPVPSIQQLTEGNYTESVVLSEEKYEPR